MKHIFIAYSPKDRKPMTVMRDYLLANGFRPWIDPTPAPGQDWRFAVDDAIRAADAVLLIMTPAAAASTYVTYEWSLALGMDIPVIPVIFEPSKMHPRLSGLTTFDVGAWTDEKHFWEYFVREMKRLFATVLHAPDPRPAHASPTISPMTETEDAPAIPMNYDRSIMPTTPGYWLVIRRGPMLNSMFKLEKPVITVGRDDTNDISIKDPEVSRYHLRIVQEGAVGFIGEDTGSTNGTLVNGRRVTGTTFALNHGDVLLLGDTIMLSYEVVS
ncbi:MAG: TIR domain-containing protein [Aggregatilineales bacterium]